MHTDPCACSSHLRSTDLIPGKHCAWQRRKWGKIKRQYLFPLVPIWEELICAKDNMVGEINSNSNYLESQEILFTTLFSHSQSCKFTLQALLQTSFLPCKSGTSVALTGRCAPGSVPMPASKRTSLAVFLHHLLPIKPDLTLPTQHSPPSSLPRKSSKFLQGRSPSSASEGRRTDI